MCRVANGKVVAKEIANCMLNKCERATVELLLFRTSGCRDKIQMFVLKEKVANKNGGGQ